MNDKMEKYLVKEEKGWVEAQQQRVILTHIKEAQKAVDKLANIIAKFRVPGYMNRLGKIYGELDKMEFNIEHIKIKE